MVDDPIVAEVRAIRDRHAAKFNCDLDAIHRDLKEREKASGRTYVRYPPRLCQPAARPATVHDGSSVPAQDDSRHLAHPGSTNSSALAASS
jgi:hypothetical protein